MPENHKKDTGKKVDLIGGEAIMERNYVKEIMKCLDKYPSKHIVRVRTEQFFKTCQEFDRYYTIYKKIEPAIRVLQNYVDAENYIAKRKHKENTEKKVKLKIDEKLYAEFFTEIYCDYYKDKYSWNNVVDNLELITEILTDYFQGTQSYCTQEIAPIVYKAYESSYKKIDLTTLHQAINIFEEAIKTPLPPIEDSLKKVITPDILELLIGQLEAGNEGGFLLTIAPMRIELTDGAYKTYAKRRKFFNLKCEYNLKELKRYIIGYRNKQGKNFEGLMDVYEVYKETKNELLELRKLY